MQYFSSAFLHTIPASPGLHSLFSPLLLSRLFLLSTYQINLESSPVYPSSSPSSASSSSALNAPTDPVLTSLVLYFDCVFEINRPPTAVTPESSTTTPSDPSGDGKPASRRSSSIIPGVYYFDSTSYSTRLATARDCLRLPEDFLESLLGPTSRTMQDTGVLGWHRSSTPADLVHVHTCMDSAEASILEKNQEKTLQDGGEEETRSPEGWLSSEGKSNGSLCDRERYLDPSSPSSLCTSSSTIDGQASAASPSFPSASSLHDGRTKDRKEEENKDGNEFEKSFSCCLSTSPLCKETHWKQTIFHLLVRKTAS